MSETNSRAEYWKANIRLVVSCLIVWAVVSYGFGILLADVLNQFEFLGVPLGIWFAQQGSIYVFVILIFFYAFRMNHLDRKFDVFEE